MIHSAFELLSHSPEAYLIVFGFALADALFPVVPSETALITAGLLCVVGQLDLPIVIAAGALGAFAGDNVSYALGRFAGRPAQKRFLSGERSQRALDWAQKQYDERGGVVIVMARYVPGGRTAATFTGGMVHFPYVRFALYDLLAAVLWATYAAVLGYLGGHFFERHPWVALAVALGAAAVLTGAIEGVRRWRS